MTNTTILNNAKNLLKEAGILNLVTVSIEDQQMENGSSRKVLAGCYKDVYDNGVHTETIAYPGDDVSRLFASFFLQRIDWLKAPHSQKNDAMEKGIHPAFFNEYLETMDVPGFEGTLQALNNLY
jgi:hypothetical protein|tara:strand:+ start:3544 stop:3915 length:372 start_codon:yes stop_codon:yes gene_type:complete